MANEGVSKMNYEWPTNRFDVLGVPITATDLSKAAAEVCKWVVTKARSYVCVRDVHGVVACQNNERLLKAHKGAGMVTPDGMPLVWVGNLLGKQVERVYGPDLMMAVCERSVEAGTRHFLFGGAPGVAELLAKRLIERFPGLQIAGTLCPTVAEDVPVDLEYAAQINEANADIVWVGLGTPKQELWMAAHRPYLEPPVLLGVGAAFDFHTGRKPQAPRWIQRSGFEWLYRLCSEPKRLWRRYLHTIPVFVFQMSMQLIHVGPYASSDSSGAAGSRVTK